MQGRAVHSVRFPRPSAMGLPIQTYVETGTSRPRFGLIPKGAERLTRCSSRHR